MGYGLFLQYFECYSTRPHHQVNLVFTRLAYSSGSDGSGSGLARGVPNTIDPEAGQDQSLDLTKIAPVPPSRLSRMVLMRARKSSRPNSLRRMSPSSLPPPRLRPQGVSAVTSIETKKITTSGVGAVMAFSLPLQMEAGAHASNQRPFQRS